jgi:HK97 family phage portal protein
MSSYLAAKHPEYLDRARTPAPISSDGSISGVWAEILGLAGVNSVAVTEDNVRGLPALNKAKALVVNSTALMLAEATVRNADGVQVDPFRFIKRPHPLLRAFEYYQQVTDSLIMHGNFVSIIVGEGDDVQLVPVPNGGCSIDDSSGLPWYRIGDRLYRYDEVLHVRSKAPVGRWEGLGVVEEFRLTLSEHLHSQSYGESSLRSGAVPSMLVKLDQENPTETAVTTAKSGLIEKLGGGVREPLVHGKGMDITPVGWSPHDAEFVESRRLSYAEACWLVGLRPEDIGASAGSSMTYGNRSDDALQRITDAYGPWMRLIEEALSDLLPEGYEVKGNPEALLRTSTRERLEIRRIAQEIGVETPEESRAEEGRPPIQTAQQNTQEAAS